MNIDITIKNYRCFGESPSTIQLRPGVTALLGPNNAGKTTILKLFYELRGLFDALSKPDHLQLQLKGTAASSDASVQLAGVDVERTWAALCDGTIGDGEIRVSTTEPEGRVHSVSIRLLRNARGRGRVVGLGSTPDGQEIDPSKHVVADLFGQLTKCVLVGSFRNALAGHTQEHYDLATGSALVQKWREIKTGTNRERARRAHQLEEDICQLFGFGRLEINTAQGESDLQLVIDGRRRNLDEVGSGMTHAIIVLANLVDSPPLFVLFDEPELGLHPRLQQEFIALLASYVRDGVVYATQSVGLARSTADYLYSVRANDDGTSRVCAFDNTPSLLEFMGELSFSACRELGCDRILFVEGVNDLPVIRQLLRLHRREHEVLLLPLGGDAGIAHAAECLDGVLRVCDNVSALIDSERVSVDSQLSPAREGFMAACQSAGVVGHVLERRSIENYFPEHAVKKVLGSDARALGPYEDRKGGGWVELSHSKRGHNPRMAREMSLADLASTDLGRFLEGV